MYDITYKQFKNMFFIVYLALNFITFPSKLADCVGSDGLLCLVLSIAIGYAGCALTFKVMTAYPSRSFIEILKDIFGKTGGGVVLGLYVINILHFVSYVIRLISEQVVVYILRDHPLLMVEAILFLTVMLISLKRLRTLGNVSQILFRVIILSLGLLALIVAKTIMFENMLPLFTSGAKDYLRGTAVCNSYLFSGSMALPFLIPFVKNIYEKPIYRDFLFIALGVLGFFALFYVLCITILGVQTTSELLFPAFSIVQSDNSRSAFFERFEVLLLVSVVYFFFIYASVMFRSLLIISDELLPPKKTVYAPYVIGSVIFGLVIFLNGSTTGKLVYDFFNSSSLTSPHALLPFVVYAGFVLKRKKGESFCIKKL